jgi:hypothetical protein
LLAERAVALPPVDVDAARGLVGGLRLATLLAGHRGAPAVDVSGLVEAVVAVSRIAHEVGDRLDALDVNPLVVLPGGVVAVDALVVPRPLG